VRGLASSKTPSRESTPEGEEIYAESIASPSHAGPAAILHSLPRIILDDGLGRQGHFAMAVLARQEKSPGPYQPATAKASMTNARTIVSTPLTLALSCRSLSKHWQQGIHLPRSKLTTDPNLSSRKRMEPKPCPGCSPLPSRNGLQRRKKWGMFSLHGPHRQTTHAGPIHECCTSI
jgi:hypothetical protein